MLSRIPKWAQRIYEWAITLRGNELHEAALALHQAAILVQRAADDDAKKAQVEGRAPSPTTSKCKREPSPELEEEEELETNEPPVPTGRHWRSSSPTKKYAA